MFADDAGKQRCEKFAVGTRPVFNRKACIFHRTAVLFFNERAKTLLNFLSRKLGVRNPFIDAEERENARETARGMGLAAGLVRFCHVFLASLREE